ncbi:amine sulfotransferase-like [Danio aesculapii]|uniref:amine sulfotransferase-like n=1 Tax=Danio aesculapii TaxID=1142201 RepID=UPI0024BF7E93|nr:amine sulfotransferase-like [Danio aesculapii]
MAQEECKMLSDKLLKYKGTVLTVDIRHDTTPEYIDSLQDFDTRDDDVFVVTFPKSGTIWTQRIMTLIYEEDFPEKANQITYEQMPWIEYREKGKDYNTRPSPRLFCSHLLEPLMPRALQRKGKIIYVMRNPKDVMVSYFHFANKLKNLDSSKSYDEMLKKFFTGCMVGGCWFDHVKGWMTNKNKYNILILTYEEMIKGSKQGIGYRSRHDGHALPGCFSHGPGDSLSPMQDEQHGDGTVGDWKNSLTVAQSECVDRVFEERMKDVPLNLVWDISQLLKT